MNSESILLKATTKTLHNIIQLTFLIRIKKTVRTSLNFCLSKEAIISYNIKVYQQ